MEEKKTDKALSKAKKKKTRKQNARARLLGDLRLARRALRSYVPAEFMDLPEVEAVTADLVRLSKIPWNRHAAIRELETLLSLWSIRTHVGRKMPAPDADVQGLRLFLRQVVQALTKLDAQRASSQRARLMPDRPIGLPLQLLLGLTHATENARVGSRRELAARERGVGTETMRRWHTKWLCEQMATEILRREAAGVRSRSAWLKGAGPLSTQ